MNTATKWKARHKGHAFLSREATFTKRPREGMLEVFICSTCGTKASAMFSSGHWREWSTYIATCGDVIAREVHEK